ncbi:MAG: PEP-CTERM sorting domain-containing protein [Tepidisphaeraceae bacterium]
MRGLSLSLGLICASGAQGASLLYSFEDTTLASGSTNNTQSSGNAPTYLDDANATTATPSGYSVSGAYSETVTSGATQFTTRYLNPITNVDTSYIKSFRGDRIENNATPSQASSSHVDFAIAAVSGYAFNLSAANLSFNLLAGSAGGTAINSYATPLISTDGVTFTPLSSVLHATSGTASTATFERTSPTEGDTTQVEYGIDEESSGNLSLTSLTGATALYFRIALGDDSNRAVNPTQTKSSLNFGVQFTGIDNVRVSGLAVTATPEPAALSLLVLAGIGLARRRRTV